VTVVTTAERFSGASESAQNISGCIQLQDVFKFPAWLRLATARIAFAHEKLGNRMKNIGDYKRASISGWTIKERRPSEATA